MPVGDGAHAERGQPRGAKLPADFGGSERRAKGVEEIALQDFRLGAGIPFDDGLSGFPAWWTKQIDNKNKCAGLGALADGLQENLRVVEMMQHAAGNNDVVVGGR